MSPPPRIRIHSLEHGRAALEAAREAARPLVLESPAGAALWQGTGWWQALLAALAAEFPGVAFGAVLDCADSPGAALAALRAGVPRVRVEAAPEVLAKLAAIAGQVGGRVEGSAEEDILDLADGSDALVALRVTTFGGSVPG